MDVLHAMYFQVRGVHKVRGIHKVRVINGKIRYIQLISMGVPCTYVFNEGILHTCQ
jgi:hypothetical protein